jgi:very-short-patch-repair endonuclease
MTIPSDLIECTYCRKHFSKYGIKNHIAIVHLGDKTRVAHNKGKKYSKPAWNKGLNKETNTIIAEMSKNTSKSLTGKKGRKHSEDTKEKISNARIKYLIENPDKVPYLLNHSSKMSYPEKLFKNALDASNITGWTYNFQNSIYQYDFAFLDKKIDVEIDGGTHLTDKVKKIDARRDLFSKNDGWIVIRFTAKEVKENIIECINKLKKSLEI